MDRLKAALVCSIACLGILAPVSFGGPGLPSRAYAATQHDSVVQVSGTVKATDNGLLIVQEDTGNLTSVQATPSTRYLVNGQPSARPTFREHDVIRVTGTRESGDLLIAQEIAVGAHLDRVTIVRTRVIIEQVSVGSLIVREAGTLTTLQLNASTVYIRDGRVAGTPPTFRVGESIVVEATRMNSSLRVARVVISGAGVDSGHWVRVSATIKEVYADSLIVVESNGNLTSVHFTPQTTYLVNGQGSASRPAFTERETVAISGWEQTGDLLVAQAVRVGQGAPVEVTARILEVYAHSLIARETSGNLTWVRLTSQTMYIVNGRPAPAPPRFQEDKTIRVVGLRQDADVIVANVISANTP